MSCKNATAPIDVNKNTVGKCNSKCAYSFNYENSGTNIYNKGDYFALSYDNRTAPPVTYNGTNFDVREIRIYQPSLHSYNGKKADAEMIIFHSTGGKNLLVCVPIMSTKNSSLPNKVFESILSQAITSAGTEGTSVHLKITDFNLNPLVPQAQPFYSYYATAPYKPCTGEYNYVVFSLDNGSIYISKKNLKGLKDSLDAQTYKINSNTQCFLNKNGPNQNMEGGDIYIECNPTGADGTVLVPEEKGTLFGGIGFQTPISNILTSPTMIWIYIFLTMTLVLVIGYSLIKLLTNPSSRIGALIQEIFD
jgi:carbonic anhydrase